MTKKHAKLPEKSLMVRSVLLGNHSEISFMIEKIFLDWILTFSDTNRGQISVLQ